MKVCPECEHEFSDDLDRCPDDGSRLILTENRVLAPGSIVDGRFTIEKELGAGGMGVVYLAEQRDMGRKVALKVLGDRHAKDLEVTKRLFREARTAAGLTHPNTIRIYDYGQTSNGLAYIAMEYVVGETLTDVLDRHGRLGWKRAVGILSQVCAALEEAHNRGIIHRDLKPDNIFVRQTRGYPDFVKLLDFGIVKLLDGENTQLTATGYMCGTPKYMSPELITGKNISARSDIYAIGVMLYELLSGMPPFDGDQPLNIMWAHLGNPVPALPDDVVRPPGADSLLAALLAKDPASRPSDVVTVIRYFEQLTERLGAPLQSTDTVANQVSRREFEANVPTEPQMPGLSVDASGITVVDRPQLLVNDHGSLARRAFPVWVAILVLLVIGGLGFGITKVLTQDASSTGMTDSPKFIDAASSAQTTGTQTLAESGAAVGTGSAVSQERPDTGTLTSSLTAESSAPDLGSTADSEATADIGATVAEANGDMDTDAHALVAEDPTVEGIPSGLGQLFVEANIGEATLTVDGAAAPSTGADGRVELQLLLGTTHIIEVSSPGYLSFVESVFVTSEASTLSARLYPLTTGVEPARLVLVESEPPFYITEDELPTSAMQLCLEDSDCSAQITGHFRTFADYEGCVIEGPDSAQDPPVNCIDHRAAQVLCTFFGLSVPTDAEWTAAAQLTGFESTRWQWTGTFEAEAQGRVLVRGPADLPGPDGIADRADAGSLRDVAKPPWVGVRCSAVLGEATAQAD